MPFPLQRGKSSYTSTKSVTYEAEVYLLPSSSPTSKHLAFPSCSQTPIQAFYEPLLIY